MTDQTVSLSLSLRRFLLVQECPSEWKIFDLYLLRDESVVFYVGQSHLAFGRVWEHLLGGFHGHSIVGRFVWANWPASMKFNIELMNSQSAQFAELGYDLNAAERALIRRWKPCFNDSFNQQPTLLPGHYRPANAALRCGHLSRLIHEAERAVKVVETEAWLKEI